MLSEWDHLGVAPRYLVQQRSEEVKVVLVEDVIDIEDVRPRHDLRVQPQRFLIELAWMTQAVVRPAEPADIPEVTLAYEWLFAPPGLRPPDWDRDRAAEAIGRAISAPSAIVLVACLDGEIVGLCTAYEDIDSVRFGRGVWVEDLAVHPEHRSAGIGKLLLDEAKGWARERGATRLRLESSEARTDAHRFYDREHPDSRSRSFGWRL
jgi:GNAT superfamily N-acetyltransferase